MSLTQWLPKTEVGGLEALADGLHRERRADVEHFNPGVDHDEALAKLNTVTAPEPSPAVMARQEVMRAAPSPAVLA